MTVLTLVRSCGREAMYVGDNLHVEAEKISSDMLHTFILQHMPITSFDLKWLEKPASNTLPFASRLLDNVFDKYIYVWDLNKD